MATLSEHDKTVLNCVFNPSLPLEEACSAVSEQDLKDLDEDSDEFQKSQEAEVEAVRKAEHGELEQALAVLNKAMDLAPSRASLYNNRAQVYQLMRRTDDAFSDLSRAIDLAGSSHKRTLCQALCQRGLLFRRIDKNDEARQDFDRAAKMGSMFARNQLVEMNPYAALCNQMLRKVIQDFK